MRRIFRDITGYHSLKLMEHEKKCYKIFNDIENGAGLYVSVEQNLTENQFVEDMGGVPSEEIQYVRVSILTDEMIEYDREMFRSEVRERLLERYRPYFISFIIPLEEDGAKDIRRDIRLLGNGWHIGQFVDLGELDEEEGILLSGVLEISASPVNYLQKKLLVFTDRFIKKSILDEINAVYDPSGFVFSNSMDIENILNNAWQDDFPDTIDIYNVGHGNADYIRGFKHRILYDIGYNYRSFPKYCSSRYLRAVNALRHLKPNCVILSHWDMDHIIGCAYAEQDIFRKPWIAPYLVSNKDKKATQNSIRLAHYLENLGKLFLVDRDQTNRLITTIFCKNGVEMKLWLGSGISSLTPKNIEGLMIEIIDKRIKYPHILLAGDVPYGCMPNILKNPIDILHVPHHCSKMDISRLRNIPGKGVCAVISTNRKKSGRLNYDKDHHDGLMIKFNDVVNTIDNTVGDDEKNLSVQIDYRSNNYKFR